MAPGPPPTLGKRIPALDGIRGLAIVLVLIFHFTLYGGMRPELLSERLYRTVALTGWIGVDLFFVLSGFLITGILYDTRSGHRYFLNFYVRRVLRIFPLYYVTLVVAFVILPLVFPPSDGCRQLLHDQWWYWTYLVNVQVALDYWPECGALGHFWSLAVEEQFYLVWPLVIFLFGRRTLLRICVACIVGALLIRVAFVVAGEVTAAYALTPSRADALAAGAWVALIAREPWGMRMLARWTRPVAWSAASGLAVLFVWRRGLGTEDPIVVTIGSSLLVLLFGAVIATAVVARPTSPLARILAHPLPAFFGRYSYGMYVVHHPIAIFIGTTALGVPALMGIVHSQLAAQAVVLIAGTALTVAISLLTWHLVESPFLKLKRRFDYFRSGPSGYPRTPREEKGSDRGIGESS